MDILDIWAWEVTKAMINQGAAFQESLYHDAPPFWQPPLINGITIVLHVESDEVTPHESFYYLQNRHILIRSSISSYLKHKEQLKWWTDPIETF